MLEQIFIDRYLDLEKLRELLSTLFPASPFTVKSSNGRVTIRAPRVLLKDEIRFCYSGQDISSWAHILSTADIDNTPNIHNSAEASGTEISSTSIRSRTATNNNSSRSINTDDRDTTTPLSHDNSSSSWTDGSMVTSLGLTQIPMKGGKIDLEGARLIVKTTYSSIYGLNISYGRGHAYSAAKELPRNQQIVVLKQPSNHGITRHLLSAEKRAFKELGKTSIGKNNILEPIFIPPDTWPIDECFFLLPLAECDLYQLFQSEAGANVTTSLNAQLPLLAEGLATLHRINIAHRDLDSRNVLVFYKGADGVSLQIADFGHSTFFNTSTQTSLQLDPMISFRSNGTYSAPECVQVHETPYSPQNLMAIDIWALGCMYLELIAFIRWGPTGVEHFRVLREGPGFVAGMTVQSDMFHDGAILKPKIREWLQLALGILHLSSTQKRRMVYRTLLEMFDTEPRKRPHASAVADSLKDVESIKIPTNTTRVRTEKFSTSGLTAKVFSWAAARISREPPIAPGNKRVHWKCACGRILHDDFTEIEPGAVDEVQKSLNELYGSILDVRESAFIRSTSIVASQENSVSGARGFIENLSRSVSTAKLGLQNSAPDSQHIGEPSELPQLHPGATLIRDVANQGTHVAHSQMLWLIACFNSPFYGTVARHEDVSKETYDFEMFTKFREIYFSHKSWFSRLFDLKEVKHIRFVRFDYLSLGKASILNKDDKNSWPQEEDRDQ